MQSCTTLERKLIGQELVLIDCNQIPFDNKILFNLCIIRPLGIFFPFGNLIAWYHISLLTSIFLITFQRWETSSFRSLLIDKGTG